MRKFGKLDDGSWICKLTEEVVAHLLRREGVRNNRAQGIASPIKELIESLPIVTD